MRRSLVVLISTTCLFWAGLSAAQEDAQTLKTAVSLAGSTANDMIEIQGPAGRIALDLYFYGTGTLKESPTSAKLAVTNLRATAAPGDVVSTTASTADGTATGTNGTAFDVKLQRGEQLRITIGGANLRPATTYKATVYLTVDKATRQWELTLTTGQKGTLVVDPIEALQFERSWGHWWCGWIGCEQLPVGEFTFSLRNKTPIGPLTNLHVRFDPGTPAATKAIRSNFGIGNLAFSAANDPLAKAAPAQAGSAAPLENKTLGAGQVSLPGVVLDTPRWYKADVSRLKPGEYSGALRFSANEALEDAADSRLALAINVRDPWIVPVLVLIVGSLIGWFATKYLVAARKARDMARTVKLLRARADDLARGHSTRMGWQFSTEATSYTLIKIRVILNKVAALSKSGLRMLFEEAELTRLKDEAEARLSKLEALRDIRLEVQPVADNRATVQRVVGRLLRRASDLLEQSVFGTPQQTAFAARLGEIEPWIANDTRLQKYREALAARSVNDNAGVDPARVKVLGVHVKAILDTWPTLAAINAADATMATLLPFDDKFETLALLCREQDHDWAQQIADVCARQGSLQELFEVADEGFWKLIEQNKSHITIERDASHDRTIDCYHLTEFRLEIPGIDRSRILKHPMRVAWTITTPGGNTRVVETDDLVLVQHFSSPGTATIAAQLKWSSHVPIEVPTPIQLTVTRNVEYRLRDFFKHGGWLEFAAILIAMVFAVATAMESQYDSTFGSSAQYLALFIWAAGAATGGNILKQLGTSSTPGGQAESTLPR